MISLAALGSALANRRRRISIPSRLVSPFVGYRNLGRRAGFVVRPLPAYGDDMRALRPIVVARRRRPNVRRRTADGVFVANLFGLEIAAVAQALMVVVLLAALAGFAMGGLPRVEVANFHPLFPHGASGLLAASALLTFAHLGANAVVELGGEIKNPGRNLPLSMAISIPLVTVVYVVVAYVTVGVVPYEKVKAAGDLTETARVFMSGGWLAFFRAWRRDARDNDDDQLDLHVVDEEHDGARGRRFVPEATREGSSEI